MKDETTAQHCVACGQVKLPSDYWTRKITYWQDLAVANRKVAEAAQAQRDKAVEMLRFMREEYASLPHSLGYTFTHLPKIDLFLKECGK
jgi:hypothetical protein